jgi:uncharacterized protein involved in exopolysaccharide biosynthesis
MLLLGIGFIVGGFVGIFCSALCNAAKRGDRDIETEDDK